MATRRARRTAAFGLRLLGDPDMPSPRLRARVQLLVTFAVIASNVVGGIAVAAVALLVTGGISAYSQAGTLLANAIAIPVWGAAAVVIGSTIGTVRLRAATKWLVEDRRPTDAEARMVLRAPIMITRLQGALWLVTTVGFTVGNGLADPALGLDVALTVALGGGTVAATSYLLVERLFRPVVARVLRQDPPADVGLPGVTGRSLYAWALGATPVVGLLAAGVLGLVRDDTTVTDLSVVVIVLATVALLFGGYVAFLAARALADPIAGLRTALAQLEDGDLDVSVPVYDATEVGRLQAGFNDLVAGLRERERLRDVFGRHVGEEVARQALDRGADLGGEVVEVGVLFVDVIGSTRLAASTPPKELVDALNRFFTVVVDVMESRGGRVDKFEGDAALVVFGAPSPHPSPATGALTAARELAARLRDEVTDLQAAVGVAHGSVVAGNVGDVRRHEYTVIGDPVNEAARLTEAAKDHDGRVLASGRAVEAAEGHEAARWTQVDEVVLRGRTEPTRLMSPTP